MKTEKVFSMSFSSIYQCLVEKAKRKQRTKEEVDRIICWMTGYDISGLEEQLRQNVTYKTFLETAPCMNIERYKVKGVICRVRIEDIQDPLMKDIRILDKLIDELAKGKDMDQILRR